MEFRKVPGNRFRLDCLNANSRRSTCLIPLFGDEIDTLIFPYSFNRPRMSAMDVPSGMGARQSVGPFPFEPIAHQVPLVSLKFSRTIARRSVVL